MVGSLLRSAHYDEDFLLSSPYGYASYPSRAPSLRPDHDEGLHVISACASALRPLAPRWQRFIREEFEIGGIEHDNVPGPLIPVEVDIAFVAPQLLDRPDLPMIAYARYIHPDPLSNSYLFRFHTTLQAVRAGIHPHRPGGPTSRRQCPARRPFPPA